MRVPASHLQPGTRMQREVPANLPIRGRLAVTSCRDVLYTVILCSALWTRRELLWRLHGFLGPHYLRHKYFQSQCDGDGEGQKLFLNANSKRPVNLGLHILKTVV